MSLLGPAESPVAIASADSAGARSSRSRPKRRTGGLDATFKAVVFAVGALVFVIIAWIALSLYQGCALTRHESGFSVLTQTTWDPNRHLFGALPFIYGTLMTSMVALIIAVPLGVGTALFLNEIAPVKVARIFSFFVELLAAVPSIVFGIWALLVLCPFLQNHVTPWLGHHLNFLPLFRFDGTVPPLESIFAAAVILSVMVLPYIAAVSRDVLAAIPRGLRDASLSLGTTKWQMMKEVLLPAARSGIVGASILGFGRAVGETMAVAFVIGNSPYISASLLKPSYTMPALLANEFSESMANPHHSSALMEIALILLAITLVINAGARMILAAARHGESGESVSRFKEATNAIASFVMVAIQWTCAAIAAYGLVAMFLQDLHLHGIFGLFGFGEIVAYAVVASILAFRMGAGTKFWYRLLKLANALAHGMLAMFSSLAIFVLGAVVFYVVSKGWPGLHVTSFTHLPTPTGIPGGGLENAIAGTGLLVAIASLIGIPIGLLGGIYLAEFGNNQLGGSIRFAADVLNGVPSVVIGLFSYEVFVVTLNHGQFSALAGGIALGILMIPIVMRTTEEMLRLVPIGARESSLSLGTTNFRTVFTVALPAARSGIFTGIMLAIARVAGETAPLLFTAFGNNQLSLNPTQPVAALTLTIYNYANTSYDDLIARAWTGALILLMLVTVMSLFVRFITRGRLAQAV